MIHGKWIHRAKLPKPVKKHFCRLPRKGRLGIGSVWQCRVCHRRWVIYTKHGLTITHASRYGWKPTAEKRS